MANCEISGQGWKPWRLCVKHQHQHKSCVWQPVPTPCASSMFKHVQACSSFCATNSYSTWIFEPNVVARLGHIRIAWFLDVLGSIMIIMIIMRCGTFPGSVRKGHGKKHARWGVWKRVRNGQLSSSHKHQNQEEDEGPKQRLCWSHDSLVNLELLEKVMISQQKFDHILIEAKENLSWYIILIHSPTTNLSECCEAQSLQNDRTRNAGVSQVEMRYSTAWAWRVKKKAKIIMKS